MEQEGRKLEDRKTVERSTMTVLSLNILILRFEEKERKDTLLKEGKIYVRIRSKIFPLFLLPL